MASLVSLLMTDIVGSTLRWAADDAAMAADLVVHDELLRSVVVAFGGTVVKHTGDGMLAVFDDPAAALGATVAIQRAVGESVWRHADGVQVRAAIHTGTVHQRNNDVFGTAVNRVARLLGACPPGAVLVSAVAAGVLAERGAEGVTVVRVGSISLAGFAQPDDVWAAVGAGLTEVGAIGSSAETGRTPSDAGVLPVIDEELVGRASELAAIWDVLGRHRLVTLVGVGGIGKTRLALEVAHGAQPVFTGGVWWIDLSVAPSAEAVVPVAMTAVGAREIPGRTVLEAFCDRFTDREAVLVIDNCEHVLAAVQQMVSALRSAAPDSRIVCTSREALGIRGEQLVPVGSLPEADALTLFAERALVVRPDLDLDTHRTTIGRICTRLDGIPLAIELAAARCRSMTPIEIDAALDDRFRLLRGGRSGAERHRTLRAAVEWSYSLLDPDEQDVFNAMAVFAGGTLIDGVAAVTGFDRFDAVDVIDRLIARSLVVPTETPLGTRYHQLETLRQYAEDRLVESGAVESTRDRHLEWMRDLTNWIGAARHSPQGGAAFRRFCSEVDNLRIAVAHALASDRRQVAYEVVAPLGSAAVMRPAWEVFEWIRPVEPVGDWTLATAQCAAVAANIDVERGTYIGPDYPLGGVPEHFLSTSIDIVTRQVISLAIKRQDAAANDLLNRFVPTDDLERFRLDQFRLFIGIGVANGGGADADTVEAIQTAARPVVEQAHQHGDEFELVRTLVWAAQLFEFSHPAEATAYVQRACVLADDVGATYFADVARQIQLTLASADPTIGVARRADLARSFKHAIITAIERKHWRNGVNAAVRSCRLIVHHEPELAASCLLVFDRANQHFPGVGLRVSSLARSLGLTADLGEVARQTALLSVDDALGLVLAALDRIIASEEAG